MTKISIIIPALNEECYIGKLLNSIKKQSYSDYEVIVADANSKDRTVKIADSYDGKVIAGGIPSVARNNGARMAKGEYLYFLDADTVLFDENFLENSIKEIEEKRFEISTANLVPDKKRMIYRILFFIANSYMCFSKYFKPRAPGGCLMVSRIAFEEIQGFDENKFFGEDFDFVCRASKKYRFGINRKVKIIISTRRFEKEGIFNLFWKYVRSEIQILVKGNVDENSIEYEFGNFDCDKSCEKKKVIR